MIASIKSLIHKSSLLRDEDKILIACSAGVDSMVLIDILTKLGYTIGIAHVDHGLRNSESDGDHAFIREFCLQNRYPFHTIKIKVDTVEGNMHSKAREMRYAFFESILTEHSYNKIATAHHLDDNIETVFFRFFRGTSLRGMTGIPLQRNSIIRPLLECTKEQILKYALQNTIAFREDSSNKKNIYSRNKIRNAILPGVQEIFEDYRKRTSTTIENLQEQNELLDKLIDEKKKSLLKHETDIIKISKASLQEYLELPELLFRLIEEYGFTKSQILNILSGINQQGNKFESATHLLSIEKEDIFIIEKTESVLSPCKLTDFPITLDLDNGLSIRCNLHKKTEVSITKNLAVINMDKVKNTLIFRPWKNGDKFQPFGMSGKSQKIKDFLNHVDHTSYNKRDCYVLVDGSTIVWVAPFRISELYKVDDSTLNVLVINYSSSI